MDNSANPTSPNSLEAARRSLPSSDIWAADILIHNDEGLAVALAIKARTAYAVSDGSYKDQRGTSAFLLQGPDGTNGRILGMNEIPGSDQDQSPYRAELGGILGVIATVNCLCRLHSISSGAIECRLDGEQAMKHASGSNPLDPQQPSFDLLVDIRNKIKQSPLVWSFAWVEGHQVKRNGTEDFWGVLNNVCDSVAKVYWNQVSLERPTRKNFRFGDEGWSVYFQQEKLAKMPIVDLYNITYGEHTSKPYWIKKHDIVP